MKGCKVLNNDEIKSLLNVAENQRERMLVMVGLYFGTRISETVSLTFGDFHNTDHLRIRRLKKSNTSTLRIPDDFRAELDKLRNEYESQGIKISKKTPLFLSRKGQNQPLTNRHASRLLQEMFQRAGIRGKVGAHSFRKTFTTKIFELTGKDIMQTANYTGHKSLNCLVYYIETTKETNLTTQLAWG